eukprot:scaffold67352_cov90-Phaeocystis_antarctica.AAC.1
MAPQASIFSIFFDFREKKSDFVCFARCWCSFCWVRALLAVGRWQRRARARRSAPRRSCPHPFTALARRRP